MPGRGSKKRSKPTKTRKRGSNSQGQDTNTSSSSGDSPFKKRLRPSTQVRSQPQRSCESTSERNKETPKERQVKQLSTQKSKCSGKQNKSSIQSQIRSTAQKAMDAMMRKEKQLMIELDEITDKQMSQLKADIKSGDMAMQIYKQQSEMIDQTLNSGREVDMYDLYESCESGDVETDVKNTETRTRIELSQDMDKMNKALDELPLGKIQVISGGVLDAVSTPVLCDTIEFRTSDFYVSISDIVSMDINNEQIIIVAAWNNLCIRSFNRSSQSHFECLRFQSKPWRIAKLEQNQLAVTLPHTNQIVTVSVTPELSLSSSLTTDKAYYGVTALTRTTLAVSTAFPPCIDILDGGGNVLRSFSPRINELELTGDHLFLCATQKGNILVSDKGGKAVLCLTPQGDLVFSYSPTGDREVEWPAGITVTDTGDILVANNGQNKVIQLSESGQFVRDILTENNDIKSPYCIYYDNRGYIYVRYDSDKVKVFTCK